MHDTIYWATTVIGSLIIIGGFAFGIYDTYFRRGARSSSTETKEK